MKKILLASAMMAGIAAFGGICDTFDTDYGCRAYDFKASVKLVDAKVGKVAGGICTDDGTAYYRVAATRKLKGVFTDCNPCNATNVPNATHMEALLLGGDPATALNIPADPAHLLIATSAQKYKYIAASGVTDKYGAGYTVDTAVFDFKLLNYFGSAVAEKSKKAEGLVAIDFVEYDQFEEYRFWSILCAGFGSQADGLLKNLSGNVAGAVTAPTFCGVPTLAFEPCLLDPSYTGLSVDKSTNPWTVQFTPDACVPWSALLVDGTPSWSTDAVTGTWSLKYNNSESKLSSANALVKKVFGTGASVIAPMAWTAPLVVTKVL